MDNTLTPSTPINNPTFNGPFHGGGSSFDFSQDNSRINIVLTDAFMHSIINKPLFVSSVRNICKNNNQCPLVPIIDAAFNAGMNGRDAWKNEIKFSYRMDRDFESLFAKSTTNRPRSRRRRNNKHTNDTIDTNKANQLSAFLNKMNLLQYYPNFARHAFNEEFNEVTNLNPADLRVMGIAKMAHIKKIMSHIEEMKEEIEKKSTARNRRDRGRDRVRPNYADKNCSRSRSRNGDDCSNTSVQGDDSTDDKLMKEFLTDSKEEDDDESEDENVNVNGDVDENEIKTSLCNTVASKKNVIVNDAFDIYYDSDGTPHCIFNDNDKKKTMERIRQKSIEKKENQARERENRARIVLSQDCVISPAQTVKGGGFPYAPLPSPASPPSPGFYGPSSPPRK